VAGTGTVELRWRSPPKSKGAIVETQRADPWVGSSHFDGGVCTEVEMPTLVPIAALAGAHF